MRKASFGAPFFVNSSMICEFSWGGVSHRADLGKPIDLSIALNGDGGSNPSAWYVDSPRMEPVRANGFVGSVAEGGGVNFRNVHFNPHGHGTHTECMGHITPDIHSVDEVFRNQPMHFPCWVLTVHPLEQANGDLVVGAEELARLPHGEWPDALVIRTAPFDEFRKHKDWSNTNPPYFQLEFIQEVVQRGVHHLLVDLPSIDRERDEGKLLGHHAFFGVPQAPRPGSTITEFIDVPQNVSDGLHLLCLGVGPMVNDAANSRPVLYPLAD